MADSGGELAHAQAPREPTYGSSLHYQGSAGEYYFDYQRKIGQLGGRLNRGKFLPYVTDRDVVLDFGCGAGHLLAGLPAAARVGVEANEHARRECEALGITCHSSLATVQEGSIDVVISNHALEHVPHPLEALRQMGSKLRPGGRLVLCVPLDDWRSQRRFQPEDVNHHLYTWNPQLLGNLLVEAGFEVLPDDIVILAEAWSPRLLVLPPPLFRLACRVLAVSRRRRELFAVGYRPCSGA